MPELYSKKYHPSIDKVIVQTLERDGVDKALMEDTLVKMSKIEAMDRYFEEIDATTESIAHYIYYAFYIDLNKAYLLDMEITEKLKEPSPKAAITWSLENQQQDWTGEQIRNLLLKLFGINTNGLAFLENKRISLYSKKQWILKQDNDLFIVSTGVKDIDVYILATDYFKQKTGLDGLPKNLHEKLNELGFTYNEEKMCYYYCTENDQSVEDSFKGQVLNSLIEAARTTYDNL
ncbi:MAG: hypothetical protein ABS934_00675 [Psychrobacillus sp.]